MEDEMYFGFDVGGTKIEFGAFDNKLNRKASIRIPTPKEDYNKLVENIVSLVKQHDKYFGVRGSVGIGFPGTENRIDGTVLTVNVPCANGKRLGHDLSVALNRVVTLENDANCFALSEAWDEELQHYQSVIGLILGTGFGGGLIYDGQVFSGKNGVAGELGHMRLPVDAWLHLGDNAPFYTCGCGKKGCLDTYLSGRGFEYLHHSMYGDKKSAQDIIQEYKDNILPSTKFIDFYLEFVAICFANIFTGFDPHVVVLGGGLSNFDALYTELPRRIKKYLLPIAETPLIMKAKYGDSGGVRGAAFLNIKKIN